VDNDDRDDIAIARLICRVLPVDDDQAAYCVIDDSSGYQLKNEVFLFSRQR
jgi:hypothetical protein